MKSMTKQDLEEVCELQLRLLKRCHDVIDQYANILQSVVGQLGIKFDQDQSPIFKLLDELEEVL